MDVVGDQIGDGDQLDAFPNMGRPSMSLSSSKKSGRMKIAVPTAKDEPYYKMDHPKSSLAVIFNHENFTMSSLKPRHGTEQDCETLYSTFSSMGFEVRRYKDLEFKELDQVLEDLRTEDHSDRDSLIITIMSHGEPNAIHAKNMAYSTNILYEKFTPDKCPSLAGKPKIYFLQACQGDKLDGGAEVQVDSAVNSYRIPLHADFLIVCSTVPGFYSWRNTTRGSWFIQALCEELKTNWRTQTLLNMLTSVNRRVAFDFESNLPTNPSMHRQKQMSCITSMLTRLVQFQPRSITHSSTLNNGYKK